MLKLGFYVSYYIDHEECLYYAEFHNSCTAERECFHCITSPTMDGFSALQRMVSEYIEQMLVVH